MKNTIKIIAAVFVLVTKISDAQTPFTPKVKPLPSLTPSPSLPTMDIYGTIPVKNCGWGLGINILSNPFTVAHLDPNHPIEMRFGGEAYWSQLERKVLSEVPLSSPQGGNAQVRLNNNVYGLNAVTRFSFPWSKKITPYVDLFAGLRGLTANMNITPDVYQRDYQQSSPQSLSSIVQFNYGITGGFMVWLGKSVKLNTSLMYSYSQKQSEIVNVSTARVEAGTVVTDNMITPKGIWIAKVGLTFLLQKGSSGGSHSSGRSGGFRSGGFFRGGGGGGIRTGGGTNRINFGSRPSR